MLTSAGSGTLALSFNHVWQLVNKIEHKLSMDLKQFNGVLADAFDADSFKRLLFLGLGKQLPAAMSRSKFRDVVITVIEAAKREGWLDQLVEAARRMRPDHDELAIFHAKYQIAKAESSALNSKGKRKRDNDFVNAEICLERLYEHVYRVQLAPQANLFSLSFPAYRVRIDPTLLDRFGDDVEMYGRALGDILFRPDGLAQDFASLIGMVGSRGRDGIRLHWRVTGGAIANIAWETLIRPEKKLPLAAASFTPFSRTIATKRTQPFKPRVRTKVTVLTVVSSPNGLTKMGLSPVLESTRVGLTAALHAPFTVTRLDSQFPTRPTLANVEQQLNQGVDVVHLYCHGVIDNAYDPMADTRILLEDEHGAVDGVSLGTFVRTFRQVDESKRPVLIVLISCANGAQGDNRSNKSNGNEETGFLAMASRLVREAGVESVIAVGERMEAEAAERFSACLYDGLSAANPVDVAVNEARRALVEAGHDWHLPILYTRGGDGMLWKMREKRTVKAAVPSTPSN